MSLSLVACCSPPVQLMGNPLGRLRSGRPNGGGLLVALLAGLGMGIALLAFSGWFSTARAQEQAVPLQCRLGEGPWQPCRMEVQDVGLHWFLQIGPERIEFRHGGDGAVRMQRGDGAWQPVDSRWQNDTSLCWDGVCAKGPIPLD